MGIRYSYDGQLARRVVTIRFEVAAANFERVKKGARDWAERIAAEGGLDLDAHGRHHDLDISVQTDDVETLWMSQFDGAANNEGVADADAGSHAAAGGPAVTFDREAFRAWCASPHSSGHGSNGEYVLGGEHDSDVDEAGGLAERTLDDMRKVPGVWTYGPGVSDVTIYRTADSEGVDGGVMVEVTVDGIDLSAGPLAAGDLVYGEPDENGRLTVPLVDAAELALGAIATAANTAVTRFRATGRPEATPGNQMPQLRGGEVWKPVTLGIDGTDNWLAVYDPHDRWNGWLCPYFRRAEAERMRLHFDALVARSGPDAMTDTLRWDGDTLVVVSGQYNRDGGSLENGDQPDEERIEPDERGLYGIGVYGWCWFAADADESAGGEAKAHSYEDFVSWRDDNECHYVTIGDAAQQFPATPIATLVQWWQRDVRENTAAGESAGVPA